MRREKSYDPKIQNLLNKFEDSRAELLKYLTNVEALKTKVDSIFPQTIDYRSKFLLEEKIKTMSAFFTTILNIRQEYNRTIKDEIVLRQKSIDDEGQEDKQVNIREIANELDKLQKEESKKQESVK